MLGIAIYTVPVGAEAAVVWAAQDYKLLRTDHSGWMELTTDGERLWVEVERE